jgi:hypothetical protein
MSWEGTCGWVGGGWRVEGGGRATTHLCELTKFGAVPADANGGAAPERC